MKTKNKVIICAIDGTIANVQHRLHFIKNPDGTMKPYAERDWDSFNAACVDDTPYEDVIEVVLNHLECGHRLYFFSGRNDSMWTETVDWIGQHVGEKWWNLQMRGGKARRPDTVVKLEMMESLLFTPEDVLCIYDDRQSVVDMWRENGFRVMQVDAWQDSTRT